METGIIEPEVNPINIGKKSVQGVIALISRQFALQLISLAAFLVISSHLSREEIGIFTAVIAIQRVISFFTDFGLGAALVQKKAEISPSDIETVFTLQAGVTFVIFLLVLLGQKSIFSFFHLDFYSGLLLLVLVFSIFLSSFKVIPSILLERKIQFEKLVIPQIIESLVFNLVLIVLVLLDKGISSYTWAFLSSSLIGIPIYYLISPWKISFGIDRSSLHHLRFGTQFQIKNILATIKDDMLTVMLTTLLSFTTIGYIGFAQRISFLTYRFIVDSVTKVTFSTYGRLQSDIEMLRKAIEKSLFFVSTVMFPMLVGVLLSMPYIINYYPKWHGKWEPAMLSIVFFSLNAMVSGLSGILVNVLDATGRVKWTLYLMVLWTALTWILTPIFIYLWGYNGVSIASFVITLSIVVTIYLVKKYIYFSFWRSIWKPTVSTILMGLSFVVFSKLLIHDIITLVTACMLSAIIYLLCIYMLAAKELKGGMQIVNKRI